MLIVEKKQAAESVDVPKGDSRGNAGAQVDGLKVKNIRVTGPCANVRGRAILTVTARKSGGELGGLHFSRRMTAAPHRLMCGVSFGEIRTHGLIAPVSSYGLMPCGKPSGLSFPRERSANPRGVSHLLGGWWGTSYKLSLGIKAMMRTSTRSVSTAFPSVPEPVFSPVESRRDCDDHAHRVNTFTGLANEAEAILARCADAANASSTMAPASRACARAFIRSYLAGLVDFCKEVEAVPSRSFTVEA